MFANQNKRKTPFKKVVQSDKITGKTASMSITPTNLVLDAEYGKKTEGGA
jgi:hypothetical protein